MYEVRLFHENITFVTLISQYWQAKYFLMMKLHYWVNVSNDHTSLGLFLCCNGCIVTTEQHNLSFAFTNTNTYSMMIPMK